MEARKYHGEMAEVEEKMPKNPTMHAEIEVKCEKCNKKRKIHVPLHCEIIDEHLECEVPEDFKTPPCDCGGEMKPVKDKGYR